MIQPKHNPKEALERMKLMMKYDSSKTLTENKKSIIEQGGSGAATTATATGGAALVGAGVGAALPSSLPLAAAGTSAVGTGAASGMVYGLSGALGVGTATAGAIIGGAAALALTPLIYWIVTKDNAKGKVEKIFKYCIQDKDKINKVKRGLDDKKIRDLSDRLYTAMKGAGTDNDEIIAAFAELQTASDFCALSDRFTKDWSSEGNGDLLEWLDDDIDSDTEWNQIYMKIRNVVEDTLLDIKDPEIEKNCKDNPDDPKCKSSIPGPPKSKYKSCSETFPIAQYCKNETIRKVQSCLNMPAKYQTGNFGPITQGYLEGKGLPGTSITQDTINKVCQAQPSTPPPAPAPKQDIERVEPVSADDIP